MCIRDSQRTIAQLFCDQVEFANVIIVNKCDLLDDAGRSQLHAFLKRANPKAKVVESTYGRVDPKQLLGTNLFSLTQAEQHPDWLKEARIGEHTAETEEYGISSFVYRGERPLHPKRLSDLVMKGDLYEGFFAGVLRSKGLMWLASRHDCAFDWSHAGCSIRLDPAGYWWAAAPDEEWPEDEDQIAEIRTNFVGEYGDRKQQLVFIGQQLDQNRIESMLDDCLLTDDEFAQGPAVWEKYEDPMQPVEIETEDNVL